MPFIGELAAIGTSIMFSIGPIYFTLAGKLVGSVVVNRTRLLIALGYLFVLHWIFIGTPLPVEAAADRWFWLSLSGIIGFVIGDAALFQAFLVLGTRLTMLIFALNPIIATFLAWMFMEENLSGIQLLGMAITLIGVTWVLFERNNPTQQSLSSKEYALGILLGVVAAAGQAGGSVTAKLGLYGDFPPLSGQIIRVGTGAVIMWILAVFSRKVRENFSAIKQEPKSIQYLLLASFLGPVIGVFFSLVALQNSEVGIASTLMSLPPVFLIPIGFFFFKEKISWRAAVGTLIAILGVAIIFLV
ncbi:MAG: DMT family transporter [Chloroflexota bacterium]